MGFTVAIIGPDGAGKSTVCRSLPDHLPFPVRSIYMGLNRDASTHLLPTTRLIHHIKQRFRSALPRSSSADSPASRPWTVDFLLRLLRMPKSAAGFVNQAAEEWYRQMVARWYLLGGSVVLFDRHFFADFYADEIAPPATSRRLRKRIHGWILKHVFPQPDLTIYLDAPAEILLTRKGEGTLELLERRRVEYRQLGHLLPKFVIVDAHRPPDEVVHEVAECILDFDEARRKDNATPCKAPQT